MIKAVFLDVGGVFHLPAEERIREALRGAGFELPTNGLARAHYAGMTGHDRGGADCGWIRTVFQSTGSYRNVNCLKREGFEYMPMKTVLCSVSGGAVACITNRAGNTIRVVCSVRNDSTAVCRLKAASSAGGPLSQLLEGRKRDAAHAEHRICHVR